MSPSWPPQPDFTSPEDPAAQPAVDAAPTGPLPGGAPENMPTAPMPAVAPRATAAPAVPGVQQSQEQTPSLSTGYPPAPAPSVPAVSVTDYFQSGRRSATPLIVGLVVLLVLGGGAAIFALTRGGLGQTQGAATPNAAAAVATYTDMDGVYTLSVPKTWLTTGNAALTTFGPAAEPGVRVEIERLEVALNGHQDDVASSFFDSAASSAGGSVTNRAGPTSVTLAGITWSQYSGDLTVGATTEHMVVLIADHAGSTVEIASIAPKDSFTSDDTQFFQPMLKSLTFVK